VTIRYQRYGLALDADRIITSGALLTSYFATHHLRGARCAVLGPAESIRYAEDAGGRIVAPTDAFAVFVSADESGFPFFEAVDAALTSLCRMLDRHQDVHLVLPNPDLIYPSAEHGFGAGSIAGMFEAALRVRYPQRTDLQFTRLGKPHAALFAEALRRSATREMVMIGDQLETDIQGARAFGLDAGWIGTGVTAGGALTARPPHLRPTYVMRSL
jgi:ribonucleotide monophosphatase NagD (HAD superfamily)